MIARAALVLLLALPALAHEGWGVVVHPLFGVVVADIPGNTIWRVTDDGAEPLLRNLHSHALILGHDGAIYGTDPDTHRVWRFDGRFSARTVPTALGLQSFLLARDGAIYSANRYDYRNPKVELLRLDPHGQITIVARGFKTIDGMREEVVVDGAFLRAYGRRIGPLTREKLGEDLLGLSSVEGDVVHVADHAGRRILRVNLRTGASEVADRSSFWWAPAGVERHGGALYVLEHLRPPLALLGDLQLGPYLRVRRNGETLATVWGRKTWLAAIPLLLLVAWLGARRYFLSRTPSSTPARM